MVHNKGYVILTLICVMLLQMPMQGCIFGNQLPKAYSYSLELQYLITTNETGELELVLPALLTKEGAPTGLMDHLEVETGTGSYTVESSHFPVKVNGTNARPDYTGTFINLKGRVDQGSKSLLLSSHGGERTKELEESEAYLSYSWGMTGDAGSSSLEHLWASVAKAGNGGNDTFEFELSIMFNGSSDLCSKEVKYTDFKYSNGTWGALKGGGAGVCR